jgi:hypothetical protein
MRGRLGNFRRRYGRNAPSELKGWSSAPVQRWTAPSTPGWCSGAGALPAGLVTAIYADGHRIDLPPSLPPPATLQAGRSEGGRLREHLAVPDPSR